MQVYSMKEPPMPTDPNSPAFPSHGTMGMEFVIIYWKDAAIHGRDQINEEDIKYYGLVVGYACGWNIHEDKEKITLAMDYFPKQKDVNHNSYRCLASYPKSGIKKIFRNKFKPNRA